MTLIWYIDDKNLISEHAMKIDVIGTPRYTASDGIARIAAEVVVYPKIYLGQTPATAHGRRALRLRALDLHARLSQLDESAPSYALLNFQPSPNDETSIVDVLLLRPKAVLVGILKEYDGPIDVRANGQWVMHSSGAQIRGPSGETPLEQIKRSRDHVRAKIEQTSASTSSALAERLGTLIGALICTPKTHPETRVNLDIEDHRQRIKVLGLDELRPLLAMLQAGAQLAEDDMRLVAQEVFQGRLWHDGKQLLFELGLASYHMRVLASDGGTAVLPLLEGASVIGRRAAPIQHEYRITLTGDDSVSNDHAIIVCGTDNRVLLRDTSTNGSWVQAPDGPEIRVHHAERSIVPGSIIRMGETRLVLEIRQ
jgi:hypothetical protein